MTRAEEARLLANALEAYCERHELAQSRVGVLLFKGGRGGIAKLRRTQNPYRSTLDRVRAFLASPPPPGLHKRPLGGKRIRRNPASGVDLADKLDALIAEHGWKRREVSLQLFNSPDGINRLRTMKPQAHVRARVEAFLRRPSLDDCDTLRARHHRAPSAPKPKQEPQPIIVKVQRTPLTFEEKLALVAAGRVGIMEVPKFAKGFDMSLVGCAAGMAVEA